MTKALEDWCDTVRASPDLFRASNTARSVVDGVLSDELEDGEAVTPSETVCACILAALEQGERGIK